MMEDLNNSLLNATQGDVYTMPSGIYGALATYMNARIYPFLISIAITVTIIFVLYGSFQYFTAYGDENRATSAKKSITYAFVGLLITFFAMGIASYVQKSLTNSSAGTTGIQVPGQPAPAPATNPNTGAPPTTNPNTGAPSTGG